MLVLMDIYALQQSWEGRGVGDKKNQRQAAKILELVHRFPYNKLFYLKYLELEENPKNLRKVYATLLEKEIKEVYDPETLMGGK